ncbi:MAG: V-type ATP synthase subunit D [Verrucomicrobiae bacterium]|nr:V-type ATP synthase subunit D [Verrucomicrobiae bacterium]
MARVRHTKNELKAQREALRRFQRFLPTLELKKQQLQMELRRIQSTIDGREARLDEATGRVGTWVRLFGEDVGMGERLSAKGIRMGESNVAGVTVPVFLGLDIARAPCDLRETPPWVDDGLEAIEGLLALRAELWVLREARSRLEEELRTTSQRVNLFEKVKIPEARENIRVIRIFLGDEQTAAVARAKLAKGRLLAPA